MAIKAAGLLAGSILKKNYRQEFKMKPTSCDTLMAAIWPASPIKASSQLAQRQKHLTRSPSSPRIQVLTIVANPRSPPPTIAQKGKARHQLPLLSTMRAPRHVSAEAAAPFAPQNRSHEKLTGKKSGHASEVFCKQLKRTRGVVAVAVQKKRGHNSSSKRARHKVRSRKEE